MNMKIITVKIGSSVLLTQRNKLDEFRIAHIADQINYLKNNGVNVILVISGAVACGANIVQISQDSLLRKAAAGIGQAYLTSVFQQIFSKKQLNVAQILFTRDNLISLTIKKDIYELIMFYFRNNIVPMINENDVIDLNSFGGNDFLGAEIALLLKTKEYLVLSTMKGFSYGVGGGEAKQQVVNKLEKKGVKTLLLNGKIKNVLVNTIL